MAGYQVNNYSPLAANGGGNDIGDFADKSDDKPGVMDSIFPTDPDGTPRRPSTPLYMRQGPLGPFIPKTK